MTRQWYKHTAVIIILHLAAWLLLFLIPYLMRPEIPGLKASDRIMMYFSWNTLMQHLLLAAVFYFNAYWLIPRLLNKKRYLLYVAAILMILLAGFCYHLMRRQYFPPALPERVIFKRVDEAIRPGPEFVMQLRPPVFPAMFSLVFIIAVSNAYRFFIDRVRQEKLQQQRETEHLKSELGFLRSQISPHFIFNVLNTLVSLARTQPDEVEPTLLKLSGLMRYMLYDTDDTKVSLTKEIEYLDAYVTLQKLRFGDSVPIDFSTDGVFFGYSIEPMLLIPFIENAFRHGLGNADEPYIRIRLEEDSGVLRFTVKNKISAEHLRSHDKFSGIALANARKRLEILYDNRHEMTVVKTADAFETKIKIILR